ncbi:hypothetical protein ASPWEDRAFT_177012 [Aspergillus wentii DTO 134E9]|uniref:Uncharacterized protein n=1 Tax=Aspergillus wentii DTO 134E9 TaxID=1073089 RepID=A0A1L9R642_ASPWE|nr:uncharacterized protein ASPWEDRAFT_177012 [Aspergillus wentii DTO 134E9]KAI9925163.1 hypothetical protein MW887_006083 [Aspergillus wentii]OJJ30348.1 hypothetical protein ASPWEDRAFT_177012 [Aspergillus wentii DTO 134E9]
MHSIQIINDNASFTSTLASFDNRPTLRRRKTVQKLSRWVSRRISRPTLSPDLKYDDDAIRSDEAVQDDEDHIHESYAAYCYAFTASGQSCPQKKTLSISLDHDDQLASKEEPYSPDAPFFPSPPPEILTPSLYAEMTRTRSKKEWRQRIWSPFLWFFNNR